MEHVLETVRAHLENRNIRVPSPAEAWSVDDGQLRVRLAGDRLTENIQKNGPSIPAFALAFSYWYEAATGSPLPAVVEVVGEVPDTEHGNRGRFMLTELAEAAGDRLSVRHLPIWTLPAHPVMNAPGQVRADSIDRGGDEHKAEVMLTQLDTTPMGKLQRQFPLGLFSERKSAATRLFPGGGAQADLWSFDAANRVLNIVELKVKGNATVGIIPEALTYARLLQRFTEHPNATWSEEWAGAHAARTAERIVVWLVAEKFHPLVYANGDSPLRWVNRGPLEEKLTFKILPMRVGEQIEWGEVWPDEDDVY